MTTATKLEVMFTLHNEPCMMRTSREPPKSAPRSRFKKSSVLNIRKKHCEKFYQIYSAKKYPEGYPSDSKTNFLKKNFLKFFSAEKLGTKTFQKKKFSKIRFSSLIRIFSSQKRIFSVRGVRVPH